MPAAVVQQGTTLDQRVVAATLADLHARVAEAGLQSPCLIIVGEVVRLHEQLAWFDQRAAPAALVEVDGVPLDVALRPAPGRSQSA
jgi:hypothetical protein